MSTVKLAQPRLLTLEMLGTLGVVGALYFTVTVLAMHFIQSDLNPLKRFASEYALGRWGWLMGVAFIVFGLGILALALGLHRSLPTGRRATAAAVLIGIMGIGIVGSGIFPADAPLEDGTVDMTFSGMMHGLFGLFGFLGLIIGSFLLRGVFARDLRWQPLARPARWFAWIIFLGLVAVIVAGNTDLLPGLFQRIWLIVMITWLVLLSLRVRQLGSAAENP
jgi:hypothetical protein